MPKAVLRNALWSASLLVVLVTLGWVFLREPRTGRRTYRIGWQTSPPYQLAGKGEPTGLAVELVRQAALRRGIVLRWVPGQYSSESALKNNKVDLWPLITITPERLKSFHITEPYVELEYTMLVRAGSSFQNPQDLAAGTVSVANIAIDNGLLHGRLPNARAVSRQTPRKAIEDVCQQRADAAVRSYAVQVLEAYGYRVLAAPDGPSALAAAETHVGTIHVLLTDVVLPGMNGRQLTDRLTKLRPDMKVLYTSGYKRDVIAHRGVLDADVAYLAKPYSPEALAAKLREVI